MQPSLKEVQGLLKRLIAAPEGVAAEESRAGALLGHELNGLIRGDERLSAIERLTIYQRSYFLRLLECLKEDYPAVRKVVGDDSFRELAAEYLRLHPSDHTSTFQVGRFLPGFLQDHRLSASWPFLGDLARLERALIDIFHAPDDVLCSADEMRAVPPHKWPLLRLQTSAAATILDSEWPLDNVIDRLNRGRTLAPPRAPANLTPRLAPK
jgi:hypothetical protein